MNLTYPQAFVITMWNYSITITNCSGLTSNAIFLGMLFNKHPNTMRQRLREFYYDKKDKEGECRQEVVVKTVLPSY